MNQHDDNPAAPTTADPAVAADNGGTSDPTATIRESPLRDTVAALLRHPATWASPDPSLEKDVLDALRRERRHSRSEGHEPG